MIHPRCGDVTSFLWKHLEKDMRVLGDALDQNLDNTAITVHLILRVCAESKRPTGDVQDLVPLSHTLLRSRGFRVKHVNSLCSLFSKIPVTEDWICPPDRDDSSGRSLFVRLPSAQSSMYASGTGNTFTPMVLESRLCAYLQDLQQNLVEAQRRITTGDGFVGSPVMEILFGDPTSTLSLPAQCPTHRSSFWTLPESMTVRRFSQLVQQSPDHSCLHLLTMFLQKVLLLLLYPAGALVAVCSITALLIGSSV